MLIEILVIIMILLAMVQIFTTLGCLEPYPMNSRWVPLVVLPLLILNGFILHTYGTPLSKDFVVKAIVVDGVAFYKKENNMINLNNLVNRNISDGEEVTLQEYGGWNGFVWHSKRIGGK